MKLNDCTTVRDSLIWMDRIVPGFWNFATKKPLPRKAVRIITRRIDMKWQSFRQLYRHINQLKKRETWSVEDACYATLLENAFSPSIKQEDWSKLLAKTKNR